MGQFHPLWSLCLPANVEIAISAQSVAERLDSLERHLELPLLITEYAPAFADRFLTHHLPECPPVELVNHALSTGNNASHNLFTHKEIGQHIINDAIKQSYETVILMLVDGLSYEDVQHWPYHPTPCLIDGPSITFSRTGGGAIMPDIGFPAIIGEFSVARRLAQVGIPHSRGYSYWEREQNDVSAFLFSGMPLMRVRSISQAIDLLQEIDLQGMYVQVVREGTDGMAHSRREVTTLEVQATVQAILDDFRHLINMVTESDRKGAVYLVSDHGILWKHQHLFEKLAEENSAHVRYTWERPFNLTYTSRFQTSNGPCYLYHYPYNGRQLRANDSGTHGGLSYWESIVPFIHVEVNV
ncbi:MAG: PglZ domain-containing protein [Chloroflexi bacterium]|nr:PglZ domain-containing protein [Chloroflexota bacterium]